MTQMNLSGRTTLITGASSGMGADFARQLAAMGSNLILVARRMDRLNHLRSEIFKNHKISIDLVSMDLSEPGAAQRLLNETAGKGIAVDVLINNAGFALYGDFIRTDAARIHQMIELDVAALTDLTRAFVPSMISRKWGFVLLVSSVAAFQPTPTFAAYAAAKSYVLSFGEALSYELRRTGVSCCVLCPGVTKTEFFDVAGQSLTPYHHRTMMDSADVASIGLKAMFNGRSSVVAGRLNSFIAWMTRFVSRKGASAIAARLMK
jgi:uncharacterized protein